MPRKTRPIDRDAGRLVRDAWLIVIASEDTHAVKVYFDAFHSSRVKVRVLPTLDNCSSPEAIVQRLDEYHAHYDLGDKDQLWYCGDTDHWIDPGHIRNMCSALRRCRQKGHFVALSNPCFELWLLLHFLDPDKLPTLEWGSPCDLMVSHLKANSSGYSKDRGLKDELTEARVRAAMARAMSMAESHKIIPREYGTSVFKLTAELLQRGATPQS